jgi:hypothetical protein
MVVIAFPDSDLAGDVPSMLHAAGCFVSKSKKKKKKNKN